MLTSPFLNRSSSLIRLDWSMSPWISLDRKPWRLRLWLSSRTVVFLLAKMIAFSTRSFSRNQRSVSRLERDFTGTLKAVMSALVVAARAVSMRLGLLRNFFASFSIGAGMVAENSIV